MDMKKLVPEFDLQNFELGQLLCNTAQALDNHRLGGAIEEEYRIIDYVSELILNKSREFRQGKYDPLEDLFFREFYGKQEQNLSGLEEANANRLVVLSEELKAARGLPIEKVNSLRDLMLKLSRATASYWVNRHPHGFRHYAIA